MAEAAYKGRRVEVEILTDSDKIRGTLFLPLAELSDFLNNGDKTFTLCAHPELARKSIALLASIFG